MAARVGRIISIGPALGELRGAAEEQTAGRGAEEQTAGRG